MAFQIENCGPQLLLIHTNDRAHAPCYYAFDLISMWLHLHVVSTVPRTNAARNNRFKDTWLVCKSKDVLQSLSPLPCFFNLFFLLWGH